jgi:hypothetical protein
MEISQYKKRRAMGITTGPILSNPTLPRYGTDLPFHQISQSGNDHCRIVAAFY